LAPDERQIVEFKINADQLSFADAGGNWILEPGEFKVYVGGQQPDLHSDIQVDTVLEGSITLKE